MPDVTWTARADVTALAAAAARGRDRGRCRPARAARALRDHPRANGAYRDARWEQRDRVNVGLALENEETLVVPVVPDADTLELAELAARRRELAERVRAGEPRLARPRRWRRSPSGPSRMRRSSPSCPVLVPPQAAALGVGATRAVPSCATAPSRPGHEVVLTLVADHRILYGRAAEAFLGAIIAGLTA